MFSRARSSGGGGQQHHEPDVARQRESWRRGRGGRGGGEGRTQWTVSNLINADDVPFVGGEADGGDLLACFVDAREYRNVRLYENRSKVMFEANERLS